MKSTKIARFYLLVVGWALVDIKIVYCSRVKTLELVVNYEDALSYHTPSKIDNDIQNVIYYRVNVIFKLKVSVLRGNFTVKTACLDKRKCPSYRGNPMRK